MGVAVINVDIGCMYNYVHERGWLMGSLYLISEIIESEFSVGEFRCLSIRVCRRWTDYQRNELARLSLGIAYSPNNSRRASIVATLITFSI
jgi:hypothetical protein